MHIVKDLIQGWEQASWERGKSKRQRKTSRPTKPREIRFYDFDDKTTDKGFFLLEYSILSFYYSRADLWGKEPLWI